MFKRGEIDVIQKLYDPGVNLASDCWNTAMQDVLPPLMCGNLSLGHELVQVVTEESVERFLLPGDLLQTFIKLGLALQQVAQPVAT